MRRTWRLRPSRSTISTTPGASLAHACRRGLAVVELHALAQRLERARAEPAGRDARAVDLLDAVARVGEPLGELRRRWSAGSARWSRRRGARPGRGAAASARAPPPWGGRGCRGRWTPRRPACSARAPRAAPRATARPSTVTPLCSSTSRAGSVTTSPPTLTRPVGHQLLGGAARGHARVSEELAQSHAPKAARLGAVDLKLLEERLELARRAALPRAAGLGVGGARRAAPTTT